MRFEERRPDCVYFTHWGPESNVGVDIFALMPTPGSSAGSFSYAGCFPPSMALGPFPRDVLLPPTRSFYGRRGSVLCPSDSKAMLELDLGKGVLDHAKDHASVYNRKALAPYFGEWVAARLPIVYPRPPREAAVVILCWAKFPILFLCCLLFLFVYFRRRRVVSPLSTRSSRVSAANSDARHPLKNNV